MPESAVGRGGRFPPPGSCRPGPRPSPACHRPSWDRPSLVAYPLLHPPHVSRQPSLVMPTVVPTFVASDDANTLRRAIADPDRSADEPKVDSVRDLFVNQPKRVLALRDRRGREARLVRGAPFEAGLRRLTSWTFVLVESGHLADGTRSDEGEPMAGKSDSRGRLSWTEQREDRSSTD